MVRKILFSLTFVLGLSAVSAPAEDQVTTIRWSELKSKEQLKVGDVVPASKSEGSGDKAEEELLIVNDSAEPMTARLVTLEPTGLKKHLYKVYGKIRYEGVKKPGHLAMWNHFEDSGPYFTKTLSPRGPMGKIHGTSTSREFILPFQSSPEIGPPKKIEIDLVLPAQGKVWITPLQLSEFDKDEWAAATTVSGAWWGNRTGAWMGAIFGPLFGILGAVVGTLTGRGRARKFCLGACWSMLIFSAISLVVGMIALTLSQPYEVYFPLLLLGVVGTLVMGSVLPQTRRRFADIELRRMEAMDTGVA